MFAGAGLIAAVLGLLNVVPSVAVLVRRLHDTDRSGWWFWIVLIPWVGAIILFVILIVMTVAQIQFVERKVHYA